MGKKSRSGIRIRDEHPESYFRELRNNWVKILKFFDADPGFITSVELRNWDIFCQYPWILLRTELRKQNKDIGLLLEK
jgi:hypothetical protein